MEEALNKYYEHFGKNYPLAFGDMKTEAEVIARINHCIKHNTPEDEPEYNDECDY